jgi:hypothetical protein
MFSNTVCNPLLVIQPIMNIFWLDTKVTKAMEEIVKKMHARGCSCLFDLVTIPSRSSHGIGGEVLQKLKGWLSPPDPSTN